MIIKTSKYKVLLLIVLLIKGFNVVSGQESSQSGAQSPEGDSYSVRWVSTFSNLKDLGSNSGFLKSIENIVFGSSEVELLKPVNLIVTDSTSFIILDQGLMFPVKINATDGDIELVKKDSTYPSLIGVCMGRAPRVYFTDSRLNQIYYVDGDTPVVLSDTLKLNQPTGIAYSKLKDEIWVSETGNHRLISMDTQGHIMKIIGHRGNGEGEFNFPTHIWIDNQGKVYVVDALNFRIQVFNAEGEFESAFGDQGDQRGYISMPKGIAVDSFGHIYVVDSGHHSIQVFDIKGDFLYFFGSQGSGNGEFWMPSGIFIDDRDYIYIADSYNSRIQVFKLIKGG